MNEYEDKYRAFLIDAEIKMKFDQTCIGVNEPSGKIESLTIETIVVNRHGEISKKEEDRNAKLV